jgi:hypothetical protein
MVFPPAAETMKIQRTSKIGGFMEGPTRESRFVDANRPLVLLFLNISYGCRYTANCRKKEVAADK